TLCGGTGPWQAVSLPTYAFQHRRFFIDAEEPKSISSAEQPIIKEPDLARWGWRPVWKRSVPEYEAGAESVRQTWLFFINVGPVDPLMQRLRDLGHRVVSVTTGD